MKCRYCPECGEKTHLAYPGGDPENGPAEPHCSAHGDLTQMFLNWAYAEGMIYEDDINNESDRYREEIIKNLPGPGDR